MSSVSNVSAMPAPSAASLQAEPGGFWRRFVAFCIDAAILTFLQMPVSIVIAGLTHSLVGGGGGDQAAMVALGLQGVSMLAGIVITFFYWGYFYSKKGASLGKMALGLRVVREETGTNLSYWQTFGRESIGKLISGLPLALGYIWAGFRPDKKTFHDLIFKTQVLRTKR